MSHVECPNEKKSINHYMKDVRLKFLYIFHTQVISFGIQNLLLSYMVYVDYKTIIYFVVK